MRSARPIVASRAGTKLPICAMSDNRAAWRMYVLLPAMFGPGDQQHRARLAAGRNVVGHERALRLQRVEHRMPPIDDPQQGLLDHLRAAIVPLRASSARAASTSRWASTAALACIRRRDAATASRSSRNNSCSNSFACSSAVSTFSSYSFNSGVM